MTLLEPSTFDIHAGKTRSGDIFEVFLANGKRLSLVFRKSPERLIFADPCMPADVVTMTEDLARAMMREFKDYEYRRTRLALQEVVQLARVVRRETCVIEGANNIVRCKKGAWLSADIELDPWLRYPPRTLLRWRASSPLAYIRRTGMVIPLNH